MLVCMSKEIQYAAWDAMKEVASSLKATYMERSYVASSKLETHWWMQQIWLVDEGIRQIDNTDLSSIEAATEFFANQSKALDAPSAVA